MVQRETNLVKARPFSQKMNNVKKYINFGTGVLKARMARRNIPILAVLCVTDRCNLKCAYCYQRPLRGQKVEFTTSEILSLIDELSKMGTKFISINGGEALIRDDIETIIDKINKKNLLVQLTTNGQLITEKIDVIKKVDSLCVSLDGNKESNDLNRGQGSYDKIIKGLECLKANNILFHTNTVITKNNLKAVDEIMALALQYGFKAQFSILRQEDAPVSGLGLDDKEIRKVIQRILFYKEKNFPVFYSYNSYKKALNWPLSYQQQVIFKKIPLEYKVGPCYIKRLACQIEADGFVYPCVTLVNKFNALNFREIGFKKAWENLKNCDCQACYNICHNDFNGIFGLEADALWNAFKIATGRIIK